MFYVREDIFDALVVVQGYSIGLLGRKGRYPDHISPFILMGFQS